MKKLIVALLPVLICFSILNAQEFRFKKEVEFSPIGNFNIFRQGHMYSAGGVATFRYFVLPKLAVYGELGMGFSNALYTDIAFSGMSYTYGAGVNYFFKPGQKGLYTNAAINLGRSNFENSYNMDDTWYAKLGLGYRFRLSEKFYLSLEQNVKFNVGERKAFLEPRIGLGFRF